MGIDTVLARHPVPSQPPAGIGPIRFVGRARTDPVTALAERLHRACVVAVDVDEVAAILEANGINDRVADHEYGVPTVFALASRVVHRIYDESPTLVYRRSTVEGASARRAVVDTLVRAAIYLTPLGIGLCTASEVDGVPALATTGTLVVGWGGGQALAYLGYRALSERGAAAAARLLGYGFAALGAAWLLVLALTAGPSVRGFAVAAAQISLFAVTAAALVTGRERTVLTWATPCWAGAGAVAVGFGRPAVISLLIALAVLVVVAFRPVASAKPTGPVPRRRWRTWRGDIGYALLYCAVGTGQAALLAAVALDGVSPARVPPEAVPLLVGVPLIELTLVWHQRRIVAARAELFDRAAFDHRLARVSAGTITALSLPVLAGSALAVGVWADALPVGVEGLAAAVLLTGVFALCLVLAAHRRAGTAAILVWWPTLLMGGVGHWAPQLAGVSPHFTETLATATLLGAGLPGLAVAAFVLRDPESYR